MNSRRLRDEKNGDPRRKQGLARAEIGHNPYGREGDQRGNGVSDKNGIMEGNAKEDSVSNI